MRFSPFNFSASHISEAIAAETLNKVNSYNLGQQMAQTPKGQEMARNFSELGNTYPNVPFRMNAYQAMAGTNAGDGNAFQTALKTQELLAQQNTYNLKPVTQVGGLKRAFQVGMLGLDSMFQPVSRGFKSAVVAAQATGKSVPGTVALATLAGIPEIFVGDKGEGGGAVTQGILNAVLGDNAGDKYREARDAYGPTELTRYIQEKNKGNPINLGTGMMPNSVNLKETQEYLNAIRAGATQQVAYNKAKSVYGRDITNAFDQAEDRFKYTTGRGEKINISPGRIIASTVTNPGSTGYSVISGVIDGVFRVAADPMNLALMYGAGVKTAMRGLLNANQQAVKSTAKGLKNINFWKGFLPGKTGKENRALYYGKSVDDVKNSQWGKDFGKAIADLQGDEGLAFLRDIKEFDRLPVSVLQVLTEVDDPLHVWTILDTVAKGGRLTEQNYDDIFNVIKEYVPEGRKIELDRVRELTKKNRNVGLEALPYKPTAYGEFFNFMNKVITGKATDVAPLRKLAKLGAEKSQVSNFQTRGLLGLGQQIRMALPKHMQRAFQLRPEAVVMWSQLDESVKNLDNMMKIAFVDPKTRGSIMREALGAASQSQLDDIVNATNLEIASSLIKQNPNLKFDIEEIVKQQANFNAEMEELRSFFSGTAGSLAFNGTKIKKRYKTLIKDVKEYYERVGIKDFDDGQLERYIFEAVPTMHLMSQASSSFALLLDPQDIVRASKAHQQLLGPEESLLRAYGKNLGLIEDKDWVKQFKIPRRATAEARSLKPQGAIDYHFNNLQNNFLKPLWMMRLALLLRVVPEEALRNAYAGKVNPFTSFFKRLSLTSNKYYEFFNVERAEEVARIHDNLGELVMTVQMKADDVEFMKNVIDVDDVSTLNAFDYKQAQKLMKHYALETNYKGEVSEYMINAAVNNFDIRNVKFAELTEKTFETKTKTIKATAQGAIKGYDKKVYNSMGEALIESGGFTTSLDERQFIDLGYRGPAEGDVFVSAYKDKEMVLGNLGTIEAEAAKVNLTPAAYLDTQIDNLFFDDDTVGLLRKDKHAVGVYTDKDGNIMIDVSIGLSGENSMSNALMMGVNAFQESVYVTNKQAAIDQGFEKLLATGDNEGLIFLHRVQAGKGAASINYDSVINKPVLEALFPHNFDALKVTVDEVKGAARGTPGGNLFNNTPEYLSSLGEQAVTSAFKTGRKDLIENMFIQVDKYTPTGKINPRYWEALWTEVEILATDPIAVRIADLGLDETFAYLRGDGKELLQDLVARSFNDGDKTYLKSDKALKEYLESVQYRIARLVGAEHKIINPQTGVELSAEAARQIDFKSGYKVFPKFVSDLSSVNNSQILEMISNGGVYKRKDWVKWKQHNQLLKGNSARLGGKSIKGKANEAFYKELIEVLSPEVDRAGLGPSSLPAKFDGTQRISESGTMIAGEDIVAAGFFDDAAYAGTNLPQLRKLVDTGYDVLLAKPSNKLNRDPLFRYSFYEEAIELMAYMDDATRAEFLKGAEAWVDGNKLWDNLIEAAKQPAVENTVTSLKQAEDILKQKAMETVKTLLYSTSNRHIASDLFNKYIPFPEIWAEVFQSWGKLITENPQKFNKTRVAIDNGESAKPWDSENGFLEEDPRTGKMMFNYVDALNILTFGVGGRALKAVAQQAAFGENMEEDGVRLAIPGYASGLNLIAQNGFAPGFGPLVTIPANYIVDRLPVPKVMQDFFLGSFGRGNPFDQLPAWLQKLWTSEETYSVERQQAFGTAVMDTYSAYVLAGKVDQTSQVSIDKYMDKSFKKAKSLFIFRGTTQFTLPTGIQPRIEVEDKEGTWWATQSLKVKYDEMLLKNGYDYMQTDIDFEEKFGINPIPLTQSKSETMGKKPIKEHSYFWWNEGDRKDLLEPGALPNTGIYIQPDTVEDELYYPAFYEIQTRNLSPREYPQFMQQSQAIFELEKKKKEIRETEPQRNWDDAYKEAKEKIQEEYDIVNIYNFVGKQQRATVETIMGELANWKDYPLAKNSPEYPFVVEYLKERDNVIDVLINNGKYSYTNIKGEKLSVRISGSTRTSKKLYGDSNDYLKAQELMRFIWADIIAKSDGTNFAKLANEVLFYEISPVNPRNVKDN